jgi:hypothetical protein
MITMMMSMMMIIMTMMSDMSSTSTVKPDMGPVSESMLESNGYGVDE